MINFYFSTFFVGAPVKEISFTPPRAPFHNWQNLDFFALIKKNLSTNPSWNNLLM